MTLITHFRLASESEDTACYEERTEEGHPLVIGTLCIQNWALPQPIPSSLRVALDFFSAAQPSTRAVQPASGRVPVGGKPLAVGKSVTVIKDTAASLIHPPEFLEQYLGRTGTVLWITADGAMVKFDDSATWFAKTELQLAE